MRYTDDAIDSALLRLFRENRVFDAGTCLTLEDLRKDWWKTGYRGSDLPAAVRRLEADGCLRQETVEEGERVVLLENGEQRLKGWASAFEDLERWIDRTLFPLGRRRTSGDPHLSRRRADRESLRTAQAHR